MVLNMFFKNRNDSVPQITVTKNYFPVLHVFRVSPISRNLQLNVPLNTAKINKCLRLKYLAMLNTYFHILYVRKMMALRNVIISTIQSLFFAEEHERNFTQ